MHIPMQRGDSLTTPVRGDHAVVLGASMSGLLAARVLAEHFAQVTIVERDRLRLHHRRTDSASELAVAAGKGWTWP